MPPTRSTQHSDRRLGWTFAVTLLCVILASLPAARAQAGDPGGEYLNAYLLADEGDKLLQAGKYAEAHRKLKDAADILGGIAAAYPTWRQDVLDYRRREVNKSLATCTAHLGRGATTGETKGYGPDSIGGGGSLPQPRPYDPRAVQEQRETEQQRRNEALLAQLRDTQSELEATKLDLSRARTAQETLAHQLRSALEQAAANQAAPEEMRHLEGEIKRLTNELAIANDALSAANERNDTLAAQLQQANDAIASLETERQELKKERAQIDALLASADEGDIKALLIENQKLKEELTAARDEAKKLAADKERDTAKIASLQERLAHVEGRLAELQAENEEYQQQIANLSNKLRRTESSLRDALSGPDGQSRAAQAALEENETLRAIVSKQLERQAWRQGVKEIVLEQLAQTGNSSRELMELIENLSDGGAIVAAEERELLRDSMLNPLEKSDGRLVGAEGTPPQYPELLGHNDGTRSELGLNQNLTEFAAALYQDFLLGNHEKVANGYRYILDVAPDNLYALRNLGIVLMRTGEIAEAESCFRRALAADSADGYSHFLLGVLHYRTGDREEALADMERGLQVAPDNAKAHHYIGALCVFDDRERAFEAFQRTVELDPTFGDAYFNLAYLCATEQPPRLNEARDYYTLAQKNGSPADPAMDRTLGS